MSFLYGFIVGPYEIYHIGWAEGLKGLRCSFAVDLRRSECDETILLIVSVLERRTRLKNNLNTEMQMASFIWGAFGTAELQVN